MSRQYKDANFRKWQSHVILPGGHRAATTVYGYTAKNNIFDVIVRDDGRGFPVVRTGSKRSKPNPVHHEIVKFFNLEISL